MEFIAYQTSLQYNKVVSKVSELTCKFLSISNSHQNSQIPTLTLHHFCLIKNRFHFNIEFLMYLYIFYFVRFSLTLADISFLPNISFLCLFDEMYWSAHVCRKTAAAGLPHNLISPNNISHDYSNFWSLSLHTMRPSKLKSQTLIKKTIFLLTFIFCLNLQLLYLYDLNYSKKKNELVLFSLETFTIRFLSRFLNTIGLTSKLNF